MAQDNVRVDIGRTLSLNKNIAKTFSSKTLRDILSRLTTPHTTSTLFDSHCLSMPRLIRSRFRYTRTCLGTTKLRHGLRYLKQS